jgi:flagellar biosynthesis chaperone FliJ
MSEEKQLELKTQSNLTITAEINQSDIVAIAINEFIEKLDVMIKTTQKEIRECNKRIEDKRKQINDAKELLVQEVLSVYKEDISSRYEKWTIDDVDMNEIQRILDETMPKNDPKNKKNSLKVNFTVTILNKINIPKINTVTDAATTSNVSIIIDETEEIKNLHKELNALVEEANQMNAKLIEHNRKKQTIPDLERKLKASLARKAIDRGMQESDRKWIDDAISSLNIDKILGEN